MSGRNTKKPQTSMRGKVINMDAMRAQNDDKVAIGNARMNARGDVVGRGGKIEIRREQIIRDFYDRNPQGTTSVSLKPAVPDVFESPAAALARMTELAANKQQSAPPVSEELDSDPATDKKERKLINKGD